MLKKAISPVGSAAPLSGNGYLRAGQLLDMVPAEIATLSRNSRSRFDGLAVQHNRWRLRLPGRSGGPHHWILDVPLDETEAVAVKSKCSLQDGVHAPGAKQCRSGRGEHRSVDCARR